MTLQGAKKQKGVQVQWDYSRMPLSATRASTSPVKQLPPAKHPEVPRRGCATRRHGHTEERRIPRVQPSVRNRERRPAVFRREERRRPVVVVDRRLGRGRIDLQFEQGKGGSSSEQRRRRALAPQKWRARHAANLLINSEGLPKPKVALLPYRRHAAARVSPRLPRVARERQREACAGSDDSLRPVEWVDGNAVWISLE